MVEFPEGTRVVSLTQVPACSSLHVSTGGFTNAGAEEGPSFIIRVDWRHGWRAVPHIKTLASARGVIRSCCAPEAGYGNNKGPT